MGELLEALRLRKPLPAGFRAARVDLYLQPVHQTTGRDPCLWVRGGLRAEWLPTAGPGYIAPECLDATDRVPSGSVKSLAMPGATIGVAYVLREAL